jgi:hypothetical protein
MKTHTPYKRVLQVRNSSKFCQLQFLKKSESDAVKWFYNKYNINQPTKNK